jgi:hypothetical protein
MSEYGSYDRTTVREPAGLDALGLRPDDTAAMDPLGPDALGPDAVGRHGLVDPDGLVHRDSLVDEVDLSADPFADDLSEQLAAREPRRYFSRATAILAALVLATGGFLAGAQVQKHWGVSSGTTAAGAGAGAGNNAAAGAGFAGGGQRAGRGGQNGTAAPGASTGTQGATSNTTTGTVKYVDGTTIYVTTPDGQTVTVRTTPSTAVSVSQKGALTDLAVGAQVTVEGAPGDAGVVNATKLTKN